jgi:glycosyltransferase involved in cell wall biosynthesis
VKLGIDATNLRSGGGISHLVNFLSSASPGEYGFDEVVVWASNSVCKKLPKRAWLKLASSRYHEKGLFWRTFWQWHHLEKVSKEEGCDVLLIPGGAVYGRLKNVVVMSQNLLPFQISQILKFGFSLMLVKLFFLRFIHASSFKRADEIIFLSHYAKKQICSLVNLENTPKSIIAHGISEKFKNKPLIQSSIRFFDKRNPFVILYVSDFLPYKHHKEVIIAFSKLVLKGLPLQLNLIGISKEDDRRKLSKIAEKYGVSRQYVVIQGSIENDLLPALYRQAQLFVFASSCENLPITLLEAMASGVAIASSSQGPMPEVLQEGAVYFDPTDPLSVEKALDRAIRDINLRAKLAGVSNNLSGSFCWIKSANETFKVLRKVASQQMVAGGE